MIINTRYLVYARNYTLVTATYVHNNYNFPDEQGKPLTVRYAIEDGKTVELINDMDFRIKR